MSSLLLSLFDLQEPKCCLYVTTEVPSHVSGSRQMMRHPAAPGNLSFLSFSARVAWPLSHTVCASVSDSAIISHGWRELCGTFGHFVSQSHKEITGTEGTSF